MGKSLDSNIYGADDNGFAQRVSAESLGGQPNCGHEDYWNGDPANDDSLIAKANVGEESTGPKGSVPKLKGLAAGNSADAEKLKMPPQWTSDNRHKPGPKSSTYDGYEKAPSNHTRTIDTDKPQTKLFRKK